MEFLFNQIRKMDVISVTDGKNMGKACDMSFTFPECRIKGLFVTGNKGFKLFGKSDVFIPMSDVVKIGEDVILVKTGQEKPPKGDRPPQPPYQPCPPQPPCPPNVRPPYSPQSHCPPPDPRRNFEDYE